MINDKRGDFTGLLFFIVSITAFAIFLLILGYIVPLITEPIKNQIGVSTTINNSINSSSTVAQYTFPTIWLIMFGGLCLGLFVTSFMIRSNPIFVPIYIFFLIIAVVIAVPLSNAYETLQNTSSMTTVTAQQQVIGFLMNYLPLITLVIGLLTLVITFAKPDGGVTLA